jgi:hypothetical protein
MKCKCGANLSMASMLDLHVCYGRLSIICPICGLVQSVIITSDGKIMKWDEKQLDNR